MGQGCGEGVALLVDFKNADFGEVDGLNTGLGDGLLVGGRIGLADGIVKQNADSVRFEHEILGSLALAEAVDTELGGVFAVGGVQPLLELFSFHADFKEDLRIWELLLG